MDERDDRDPLEALRAAWRRVEPADPGSLAERELDGATRAVIQRLRRAYALAAPEPAALPWRVRLRAHRRALRRVAVAALVLALAALATRELAKPSGSQLPSEPAPIAAEPAAAAEAGVLLASLTPECMELRSGPVRLILLTPAPGDSPAPDDGDSSAPDA
ncbi:MAG TPA: hypothetical protein VMS76_16845, partial [Planctomycetota bacterium]|nr:hypothetical protein [Planctomycetota bacterium]